MIKVVAQILRLFQGVLTGLTGVDGTRKTHRMR